jgi:RNA polymerase nonessential primary-like sigma factor
MVDVYLSTAMPRLSKTRKAAPRNEDAIRQMLKSAGRYPLLTADQEKVLGRQVQAAIACCRDLAAQHDALKHLRERFSPKGVKASMTLKRSIQDCLQSGLPSPEERHILKAGSRAVDRFVNCNLRLVANVGKKFNDRLGGLEYEDLLQEGAAGLVRGAEKFDPAMGYKFSTYCYWWIRQAMTRALADKGRVIRLPIHIHEDLVKLKRIEAIYIQSHQNAEFDRQAIACELYPDKSPTAALKKYWALKAADSNVTSLDLPVGDEKDNCLGDLVPDPTRPEEQVEQTFLADSVQEVLATIPFSERERYILRKRILPYDRATLSSLGESLGGKPGVALSRERVRQIEMQALRKLRANRQLRVLAQGL